MPKTTVITGTATLTSDQQIGCCPLACGASGRCWRRARVACSVSGAGGVIRAGGSTRGSVMLLDRLSERAALSGLLDAARAGRSGVLVLRGEPGIG